MMTINIFKNYGCLAAEKRLVYTYGAPEATAACSDKMTVKVPDDWETYRNNFGEDILVSPWGKRYRVHDVLCGDKHPCFRTFGNGERIRIEEVCVS